MALNGLKAHVCTREDRLMSLGFEQATSGGAAEEMGQFELMESNVLPFEALLSRYTKKS